MIQEHTSAMHGAMQVSDTSRPIKDTLSRWAGDSLGARENFPGRPSWDSVPGVCVRTTSGHHFWPRLLATTFSRQKFTRTCELPPRAAPQAAPRIYRGAVFLGFPGRPRIFSKIPGNPRNFCDTVISTDCLRFQISTDCSRFLGFFLELNFRRFPGTPRSAKRFLEISWRFPGISQDFWDFLRIPRIYLYRNSLTVFLGFPGIPRIFQRFSRSCRHGLRDGPASNLLIDS